ncbi:MAG: GntR family transcriptional regulator [Alsobacter sp.]
MTVPVPGSPLPDLDRTRFYSAGAYAYACIRQAIVEGRLTTGRRLPEAEMASWLGISRTPLRQALARLELDGLVETLPRAGLVIASLDEDAVAELYGMREVLEGTAAGLAAQSATERDIDRLVQLAASAAPAPGDGVALYRLNRAFHEAIYVAAHNRYLLKTLQALHDSLALLGPTTLTAPGRPDAARGEHERIVAAIVARDAGAAETAARAHIRNGFLLRRRRRLDAGG